MYINYYQMYTLNTDEIVLNLGIFAKSGHYAIDKYAVSS